MRKIGFISLALAAALLPSTMFAGRLDGIFQTQDSTTGLDNEQCIVAEDREFGVAGEVSALNGPCVVRIRYGTFNPHRGTASAIRGDRTTGSVSVSQSIFTNVNIVIEGELCLTAPYSGVAAPEKCRASSSMRGTVGDPDSVTSSNGSLSCELGVDGSELSPPPSLEQVSTITAAFAERRDVRFQAPNKGRLSIRHKGVVATTSTQCFEFATTPTTTPTTTTTTTTLPAM
jgi:hypothetical protein